MKALLTLSSQPQNQIPWEKETENQQRAKGGDLHLATQDQEGRKKPK